MSTPAAICQETDQARQLRDLSVAQLDQTLAKAAQENARSERLMCEVLHEMNQREGHKEFGYSDIWDYAAFRFGFSERKTRYLLSLGRKLGKLPQLREAMAEGRIGWSKASKVAQVAKPEDEAMWLDSALSLSVRALDQKIREDSDGIGVKVRLWISEEQSAVWNEAVEVCRKLVGEDIYEGRCLELMAGEFLATYAYLAHHKDETLEEVDEEPIGDSEPREGSAPLSASDSELDPVQRVTCPEGEVLPPPVDQSDSKTWKEVLERDHYHCQYPGCSGRRMLHVHHIEYRSRSGRKGKARSNSHSNLVTICVFHHRTLHAGVIGVKGHAPDRLEWRFPKLMEDALSGIGDPPVNIDPQSEAYLLAGAVPGPDLEPARV